MSNSPSTDVELSEVLDALSDAIFLVDAQWRITYANQRAASLWGRDLEALLDQVIWESIPDLRGTEMERKLREALADDEGGEFEARSPTQGRWLRLRVLPQDERWLVASQDITDRRQTETRLQAERAVTRVLAESRSMQQAAPAILEAICDGLEADLGYLWLPDQHNPDQLCCVESVAGLESEHFDAFDAESHRIGFATGEGLPGRVRQQLAPAWIPDLAGDQNFPRAPLAAQAGLRSGFAFPILTGPNFFGVMEFFTTRSVELGEPMLEMMASIGSEIGQFIQRWQAEAAIQTAQMHLRAVLESALDCIITMDEAGRITEFNPAAQQTFGYQREEVIGRKLADCIIPPELRRSHREGLERFIRTGKSRVQNKRLEMPAMRADGTTFPAELTITHRRLGGGELLFTGYLRDITEQKQARAELVDAKEKAEQVTRLKSTMLSNLSHEIRTPLTSLLAWATILRSIEPGDERHEKGLDIMERSAKRLSDTLDSVLTLAQLEDKLLEPNLEPINVCRVVEETTAEFEARAVEQGLWLRTRTPEEAIYASLDPTLLARVLTNLISNAIKFTDTGGVTVSLQEDAGQLVIEVDDTGIGISEEFLPHLFNEFEQESSGYTRTYQGTGLGLAITQRLITAMGGTITVDSQRGQGSTFRAVFPRLSQSEMSSPVDDAEQVAPQNHREQATVLLVEDNESIREVVTEALRSMAEVVSFSDAESALADAEREGGEQYDLVLMDISLPGMDGLEATQRLRKLAHFAEVPIIAITGHAMPGDRENILSHPFDAYLAKPFSLAALSDLVSVELERVG